MEDELEITICMYLILQELAQDANNWFATMFFHSVIKDVFHSCMELHYLTWTCDQLWI